MQRVYSLLVDNNSGVLSRISGLFTRRGYNIDSITAGVTADSRFTRITIVSSGDEIILSQIEKQIAKLEDVIVVKVLKPEESVYRELILVKIRANAPVSYTHLDVYKRQVNTCCFIHDAKEESIQTILEMAEYKKEGKLKALIVTGCLAQRYQQEIIDEIPEVDAVLGTTSYRCV